MTCLPRNDSGNPYVYSLKRGGSVLLLSLTQMITGWGWHVFMLIHWIISTACWLQ